VSSNSGGPSIHTLLTQLPAADLRHLRAYIITRRRIYLHWTTYNGWTIIP